VARILARRWRAREWADAVGLAGAVVKAERPGVAGGRRGA